MNKILKINKVNDSSKQKYIGNKGVTIVALAITIIVMLILAGTTIILTMKGDGIFSQAIQAEEKHKIGEYKDKVELARVSVSVSNMGEVTLDNLIEQIYKEEIVQRGNIAKLDDERAKMLTKEGYVFIITADKIEYAGKGEEYETPPELQQGDITFNVTPDEWTNGNVKVGITNNVGEQFTLKYSYNAAEWINYTEELEIENNMVIYACLENKLGEKSNASSYAIIKIDKLEPIQFVPNITTTTNSITIEASEAKDAEASEKFEQSGIREIWYSKDAGATWQTNEDKTQTTYEYTELTQKQEFKIQVKVIDNAENQIITKEQTASTAEVTLAEGNLSINGPTWDANTHTASVTITKLATIDSNLQIQYQVVTDVTNITEENWKTGTSISSLNLNDIVCARLWDGNNGGSYTSLKITDTALPTASISAGTVSASKSVTLTASGTDSQSGVDSYEIYVNGTKVSTTSSYTITNMPFNTNYSYYVIVTDKAGNSKQSSTGTVSNKLYVSNATDLRNLATAVNSGNSFSGKTIIQTANIALGCSSTNQWTPIGNSNYAFAGTYDGNHKTISGMYINNTSWYQGLFGYNKGSIVNLGLTSGTVKGMQYIGGIVGYNDTTGFIASCYNKANIIATIVGSYPDTATTDDFPVVGGISGYNLGEIGCSYNSGQVTVDVGTNTCCNAYVGGIIGRNYGSVDACYNEARITGKSSRDTVTGGIVADNRGTVMNCYNKGTIQETMGTGVNDWCGGIIGLNRDSGTVTNCYNIGSITGKLLTGGITYNTGGTVTNSYYLDSCGATGEGTSKTAAQLKALASTLGATFKADSSGINGGYPILSWQ